MRNYLNAEFILVKFPLIFPLIYFIILSTKPELETLLIFFTIIILAETHFGATWPFFLNKTNFSYIKSNRTSLIIIPVTIALLSLISFIFFKSIFLLIFFACNVYHVTRQSYGVCKLYTSKTSEINFSETFIYVYNFIFFVIGFFRFYLPLISQDQLIALNLIVLSSIFIILLMYFIKFKFSNGFFTFTTGLIIFYPICFVNNPVHAIIMGVTMHYTQYLFLTFKVYQGRIIDRIIQIPMSKYLGIIIVYSLLMSFLSLAGKSTNDILNFLIIIPIIGQMLHFYLDSQLWKFSEPHNRENILKYIKI
jgi:hypothetical protein